MEKKQTQEEQLAIWCMSKFNEARLSKSKFTSKWKKYIEAYNGDYFENASLPEYRSNQISNFIYSTVEAVKPIMADGEHKFEVLPLNQEGVEKANTINKALDYEFIRDGMRIKVLQALTTSLQIGSAIFMVNWNGEAGADGEVECKVINPFNFFVDPHATTIEDAEYVIYATYKHINQVKKLFPNKSNLLESGSIKIQELATNSGEEVKDNTQVLVLEVWCRDYTYIDVEEVKDGQKVKEKKRKYPNGRVITVAPDFNVVLKDTKNPYDDGEFPFVILKDLDVPFEFWGMGEVEQLLSPQTAINDLNNLILDNAKTMGNQQWIVDKNAGIAKGKLTNRPGLIIRKNPGSEVR